MPSIPAGLGARLLVTNYTGAAPGGVMRTEIEGGPSRLALAFDRGVQAYNVSLHLSALEMSVWSAFFFHIIKKGALTFGMPLDSGFGLSEHQVSMVPGSYSSALLRGGRVLISFVVEAEPQAYEMTATDAQSLVDLYNEYGADTAALLARLAQFATVDTNVLDF